MFLRHLAQKYVDNRRESVKYMEPETICGHQIRKSAKRMFSSCLYLVNVETLLSGIRSNGIVVAFTLLTPLSWNHVSQNCFAHVFAG